MVILLCGASDMARKLLAERFSRHEKPWKHLPLERVHKLMEMQKLPAQEADEDPLFIRVACHCAQEMTAQGHRVVLSHPVGVDILETLREELEPEFLAFHLGPVDGDETDERIAEMFDFLIDSRQHSVSDAFALMLKAIDGR